MSLSETLMDWSLIYQQEAQECIELTLLHKGFHIYKVPGEFLESVQNTPSSAGSLTTGIVLRLNWAIESKKNVCMMVGIETTIPLDEWLAHLAQENRVIEQIILKEKIKGWCKRFYPWKPS